MKLPRSHVTALVLLAGISGIPLQAQRGFGNALFQRYPFDKWAGEAAKPQIRWNVRIEPASLSPHQRLVAQIHVAVEGAELQKRDANGQMVVLARIEDSAGHRWQTGFQTTITRLRQGLKFRQLDYSVSAFILPGDYFVSLAVCDGRTLEHSYMRRPFHVAEINSDPLPNAWTGLPTVEFLSTIGSPEAWYLPQLRARLSFPVEAQRPLRVELLVNTTPSDLASTNMFRQNMEVIVPSLKVLSGIDPARGSVGLSIIDLNRRLISYEQPNLRSADWRSMRRAFTGFNAASVDVKTLEGQRKMLDYFAAEAQRRLGDPANDGDLPHVLIVLSAPVFFTHQEKPPLPELPPDPGRRVFYIRYAPQPVPAPLRPEFPGDVRPQPLLFPFSDDIEHLLKPMRPRVFRVTRPEEFRKALGAILTEIAKM